MKTICVVTNCFNEEDNIVEFCSRFKTIFKQFPQYQLNILIVDNASTDKTKVQIEELCRHDKSIRAIFNSRNFGHVRSPFHGIQQAEGDAVFAIVSDLQIAPEIITEFIAKWEEGNDLVFGIRKNNTDTFILSNLRDLFYYVINKLSDIEVKKNFIGVGLYDKKIIDLIKTIHDPYPYFRGMVCELGFKSAEVSYIQTKRSRGITKNNFLTLYDLAMLGICHYSKVPLRIATLVGFLSSILSFFVSVFYLVYKLIYWESFRIGTAPVIIGIFFLSSVQLMFLGIIGEYIGFIFTKVQNRPLVFEEKRINF